MKYMFQVILSKNENAYALFSALRKKDIKGVVLPAQSLKSALLDNKDESIPAFAGLRHVVEYPHDNNYVVYCIIDESRLEEVKQIVRDVTDEIKHKVGIMFAMPLAFVEGLDWFYEYVIMSCHRNGDRSRAYSSCKTYRFAQRYRLSYCGAYNAVSDESHKLYCPGFGYNFRRCARFYSFLDRFFV